MTALVILYRKHRSLSFYKDLTVMEKENDALSRILLNGPLASGMGLGFFETLGCSGSYHGT